ncbi:RHS repeat-associated core domain-containing protein [Pseudoalteromonas piscicida]|nr:RHS repeat-associated core domain-containing protein [Pseudoalteromonas piscicida]
MFTAFSAVTFADVPVIPPSTEGDISPHTLLKDHISDFPTERISIQDLKLEHTFVTNELVFPSGQSVLIGYKAQGFSSGVVYGFYGFDESRHGFSLEGQTSVYGTRALRSFGCLGQLSGLKLSTQSATGRAASAPLGSTSATRHSRDIAVFQGGAVLRCVNTKPVVIYPDGMKVKFGHKVATSGGYYNWPVEALLDKFGNTINVNGSVLTVMGSTVSFSHDSGRLKSINVNSNGKNYTTEFEYDSLKQIDKVTDPEGRVTGFTHTGGFTGGSTSIKSVELPSGLKVTYDYSGYWEGSRNSLTVKSKKITGPHVKPREFFYTRMAPELDSPGFDGHRVLAFEYALDSSGDSISGADGFSDVYYIHSNADFRGKIYKRERYSGPWEQGMILHSKWEAHELLLRQEIQWQYATLGSDLCFKQLNSPYFQSAYGSGCGVVRKKREYTSYKMDDGYDTYAKEHLSYDSYNNSLKTRFVKLNLAQPPTGDISGMVFEGAQKYAKVERMNDNTKRVIGKVAKEYASTSDGSYVLVSEKKYNADLEPTEVYRFGQLIKTDAYYSHGGLSSTTFNVQQKTSTDKVKISYGSNYVGGVAQVTTRKQPHADNEMNSKAAANVFGWVTQNEAFDGTKTYTRYDDIGRIVSSYTEKDTDFDKEWVGELSSYDDTNHTQTVIRCKLNEQATACLSDELFKTVKHFDGYRNVVKVEYHDLKSTDNSGRSRYQIFKFDKFKRKEFQSVTSQFGSETKGTSIEYDLLGRPVKYTTTGKGTIVKTYKVGNKIATTDAEQNTTTTTYYSIDSPSYQTATKIESPEQVVTTMQIDIFGLLHNIKQTGLSKSGTSTTLTETRKYDSNKRLCLVIRPDVGNTLIAYNAIGEVIWKKAGVNNTQCVSSKPSGSVAYYYNNTGKLRKVDYVGEALDLTYTYDFVGNLTKLSNSEVTHTYSYNNKGLLEDETLLIASQLPMQLDYNYDSSGHLSQEVYPDGTILRYEPNGFGAPQSVKEIGPNNTVAQVFATNVKYHPTGDISSFSYGNGVEFSMSLESQTSRPQQLSYKKGNTYIADLSYGYNNNDSVTSIIDGVNDSFSLERLDYDGLDRLTTVSGNAGIGSSNITYDGFGNITSYSSKGRALDYKYDYSTNRLIAVSGVQGKYSSFDYTTKGSIKHNGAYSMVYNDADQMVSAKGNSYLYDGFNRRVKRVDSEGISYSFYSQAGTLLYSEKSDTITLEGTNYIYLAGKLIAKYGDVDTSRTVTQSKQYYKPYGETVNQSEDDIGYTGHKFDTDINLSYMQARYYDPVIGRFYSNDPLSFRGIHSFNRYAYGNNNPYKYIDPDGLNSINILSGFDQWVKMWEPAVEVGENISYSIPTITINPTRQNMRSMASIASLGLAAGSLTPCSAICGGALCSLILD